LLSNTGWQPLRVVPLPVTQFLDHRKKRKRERESKREKAREKERQKRVERKRTSVRACVTYRDTK